MCPMEFKINITGHGWRAQKVQHDRDLREPSMNPLVLILYRHYSWS